MALEGQPSLIEYDGGVLAADAVLDASAQFETQPTQLPIEDGSVISDHVIHRPVTLSLTLIQTESPLSPEIEGFARTSLELDVRSPVPQGTAQYEAEVRRKEFRPTSLLALQRGVTDALFGPGSTLKWTGAAASQRTTTRPLQVTVLAADAPQARANAFHDELSRLQLASTPLKVTFKGRPYSNMILTSVTRTDTAGSFGASRFSVQLQQITQVTTLVTDLPAVPAATTPKKRGGKDGKDGTGTAEERKARASVAVGTLDVVGNALGFGT